MVRVGIPRLAIACAPAALGMTRIYFFLRIIAPMVGRLLRKPSLLPWLLVCPSPYLRIPGRIPALLPTFLLPAETLLDRACSSCSLRRKPWHRSGRAVSTIQATSPPTRACCLRPRRREFVHALPLHAPALLEPL